MEDGAKLCKIIISSKIALFKALEEVPADQRKAMANLVSPANVGLGGAQSGG